MAKLRIEKGKLTLEGFSEITNTGTIVLYEGKRVVIRKDTDYKGDWSYPFTLKPGNIIDDPAIISEMAGRYGEGAVLEFYYLDLDGKYYCKE